MSPKYIVWARIERERDGNYEDMDEPVPIGYPATLRQAREFLDKLAADELESRPCA